MPVLIYYGDLYYKLVSQDPEVGFDLRDALLGHLALWATFHRLLQSEESETVEILPIL